MVVDAPEKAHFCHTLGLLIPSLSSKPTATIHTGEK